MKKIVFSIAFIFTILFSFSKNELKLDSISTIIDTTKFTEIFDRAEIMPAYPGGVPELMKFLAKNIRYPALARENGLQGKVIVKFYIDIDGTVKEPAVLKDGVGGGCAEEAVRVINKMPKWSPGSQKGKPVKTYYTLPITFKLDGEDYTSNPDQIAVYQGGNVQLEFYKQDIISKLQKSKNEKNKKLFIKTLITIDELGKISNVIILETNTKNKKNIAYALERIKSMPNWYPAMFNKKSVASKTIILIEF